MFDLNQSFFRPLWLRIIVVAVAVGWGLVEMNTGSPGWAIMFIAVGAYAAWSFFINFKPIDEQQSDPKEDLKKSENKDNENG